jgi:predicted RNase H-like HicB family nuclease
MRSPTKPGLVTVPQPSPGYSGWNAQKYREAIRPEAEVAMQYYIALIHKDADSDYGVSFPDFPGLVAAGKDLDDARSMAEEALALHIEGLAKDGAAISKPSSMESVMADADNRGGVAVLIAVKTDMPKAVRVNITLPEDVLGQIDRFAQEQGLSRSAFLSQAAQRMLKVA